MICKKCGYNTNNPKKKFCPMCGNEIDKIIDQTKKGKKSIKSTQNYNSLSVKPEKQTKIHQISKTKENSKKCIILGLISLGFFIFSSILSVVMIIINPHEFPYEYNFNTIPLWVMYILITMLISITLGLLIGLFSIRYSITAEQKEWNSSTRAFGRGIAFISFFLNVIAIVYFFIFTPMLIFDVMVQ